MATILTSNYSFSNSTKARSQTQERQLCGGSHPANDFRYFTILNAIQTRDVEMLHCNVSTRFGNDVQPNWHKGAMQLAEMANKFRC
ncbi:hypothetical protein [Calothrix sp. NIES-2100]|uniref:hypothetical protein n=1 Tax=Calothrix sp. NIES-2100 TaxID=1954172 RepID=UPI000BBCAB07